MPSHYFSFRYFSTFFTDTPDSANSSRERLPRYAKALFPVLFFIILIEVEAAAVANLFCFCRQPSLHSLCGYSRHPNIAVIFFAWPLTVKNLSGQVGRVPSVILLMGAVAIAGSGVRVSAATVRRAGRPAKLPPWLVVWCPTP